MWTKLEKHNYVYPTPRASSLTVFPQCLYPAGFMLSHILHTLSGLAPKLVKMCMLLKLIFKGTADFSPSADGCRSSYVNSGSETFNYQ